MLLKNLSSSLLTKLFFIIMLLLISSSPLFAFKQDQSFFLSSFGFGLPLVESKNFNGVEFSQYMGGVGNEWKNPEKTNYMAVNAGFCYDYMIRHNLAITGGFIMDLFSYIVKWPRDISSNDAKLTVSYTYLSVPIGVRYYYGFLMVGGGLYYSMNIRTEGELKSGASKSYISMGMKDVFGLYIDAGLKFEFTSINNMLLIFVKYRHDFVRASDSDYHITDNVNLKAVTLNAAYGIYL